MRAEVTTTTGMQENRKPFPSPAVALSSELLRYFLTLSRDFELFSKYSLVTACLDFSSHSKLCRKATFSSFKSSISAVTEIFLRRHLLLLKCWSITRSSWSRYNFSLIDLSNSRIISVICSMFSSTRAHSKVISCLQKQRRETFCTFLLSLWILFWMSWTLSLVLPKVSLSSSKCCKRPWQVNWMSLASHSVQWVSCQD